MDLTKQIIIKKYNWFKLNNVCVVGFCWYQDSFYSEAEFAKLLTKNSENDEALVKCFNLLSGQFSFIINNNNSVFIGSNITLSYPVFYTQNGQEISDSPEILLDFISQKTIDTNTKNYFLQFGVCPENKTLIDGINQVHPGELIHFKNNVQKCYSVLPKKKTATKHKTETELRDMIHHVFSRFYKQVKNKHVVVPLTAGYDSRLLAGLLKTYGHKNVTCATWGRKNNAELPVAEKVAKTLGYKHIFIEYNAELIEGFPQSSEFIDYANYSGHLSSMPFLQDYFAVKYLIQNNLASEESIFMPGHSGDFFAGSHLSKNMETASNKQLIRVLLEKYASSYSTTKAEYQELTKFIKKYFEKPEDVKPWQRFENWDFIERQCKFINNCNMVYSFFGLNVSTPLFDQQFIKFFNDLSFELKRNANFYNSTLEKHFFKPLSLDFDLKKETSIKPFWLFKSFLLKNTPEFLKKMYYPLNDTIFYREITDVLMKANSTFSFKNPLRPQAYNSYITQWYLQHIESSILVSCKIGNKTNEKTKND